MCLGGADWRRASQKMSPTPSKAANPRPTWPDFVFDDTLHVLKKASGLTNTRLLVHPRPISSPRKPETCSQRNGSEASEMSASPPGSNLLLRDFREHGVRRLLENRGQHILAVRFCFGLHCVLQTGSRLTGGDKLVLHSYIILLFYLAVEA